MHRYLILALDVLYYRHQRNGEDLGQEMETAYRKSTRCLSTRNHTIYSRSHYNDNDNDQETGGKFWDSCRR